MPQKFVFRSCYLDDEDFQLYVLFSLEQNSGENQQEQAFAKKITSYHFQNIQFVFKCCSNITHKTIKQFELWQQNHEQFEPINSQIQKTSDIMKMKQGCGLSLQKQKQIGEKSLLRLCAFPFFQKLTSLKLRNLQKCDQQLLQQVLCFRQEEPIEGFQYKSLNSLSFDNTVCHTFDELPLHLNWDSLTQISFVNNLAVKQQITFKKLLQSSLPYLEKLKLRNCILQDEFFKKLERMQFLKNLKVLDFQDCNIDVESFNRFLSSVNLEKVEKINLKGTNINDQICYQIALHCCFSFEKNSSQRFLYISESLKNLTQLDISNIQSKEFTHKGVKYLLQCDQLQCLNIQNNSCIDDTIADYISETAKRRQNILKVIFNDEQFKLQQLNLCNCKNITSAFFYILAKRNLLSEITQLNIQNTKVCGSFLDLLTDQQQEQQKKQKQEQENLENEQKKKKQNLKKEKKEQESSNVANKEQIIRRMSYTSEYFKEGFNRSEDQLSLKEEEEKINKNVASKHKNSSNKENSVMLQSEFFRESYTKNKGENQVYLSKFTQKDELSKGLEEYKKELTNKFISQKEQESQDEEEEDDDYEEEEIEEEEQQEENEYQEENIEEKKQRIPIIKRVKTKIEKNVKSRGSFIQKQETNSQRQLSNSPSKNAINNPQQEEGNNENKDEQEHLKRFDSLSNSKSISRKNSDSQHHSQSLLEIEENQDTKEKEESISSINSEQQRNYEKQTNIYYFYKELYKNDMTEKVEKQTKKSYKNKIYKQMSRFYLKLKMVAIEAAEDIKYALKRKKKVSSLKEEEEAKKEENKQNQTQGFQKIQYLNISNCQNIPFIKICELLYTKYHQISETLNILILSNSNLTFDKENGLTLSLLLENFPSLIKIDISNNDLSPKWYIVKEDSKCLQNIHKLKANNSNFNVNFFRFGVGNLNQIQFSNCKNVTKQDISQFIKHIIDFNKDNQSFDIIQIIQAYKHVINIKIIRLLFEQYPHIGYFQYLNFKEMSLLELDFQDPANENLASLIIEKLVKVEAIDFSKTRIQNQFIVALLECIEVKNAKREECFFQRILIEDCPMIDGSILKPSFDKSQSLKLIKPQTNLARFRYFKGYLLLNDIRDKLRDENLQYLEITSANKNFQQLMHINLSNNQLITIVGFTSLFQSNLMTAVETLDLSYTQFGDREIRFILTYTQQKSKRKFSKLKALKIKGCWQITKKGLIDFCQINNFDDSFNIKCIFDLPHLIDISVVKEASNSKYMKNVVFLDLENLCTNQIDQIIAQICLKGKDVNLSLRVINLKNTLVSDEGLQLISVSENLKCLQKIYLNQCQKVNDKGISYLLESSKLLSLDIQQLIIEQGNKIRLRVFDTLIHSEKIKTIKELVFFDSFIADIEVQRLLQIIPNLANIQVLDFQSIANFDSETVLNLLNNKNLAFLNYIKLPKNVQFEDIDLRFKKNENLKTFLSQLRIQSGLQGEEYEAILNNVLNTLNITGTEYENIQQIREKRKIEDLTSKSKIENFLENNGHLITNNYLYYIMIASQQILQNKVSILQLDFSNNKYITDQQFLLFYIKVQLPTLKKLNMSNTLMTINTFYFISQKTMQLENFVFLDCKYLDYKQALRILLKVVHHPHLLKIRVLFQHINYINDQIFTEYINYYTSFYIKNNQNLKYQIIPNILNLENSEIEGQSFGKLLGYFTFNNVQLLNISNTQISASNFKQLVSQKRYKYHSQNLRYIWAYDTPQIKDENLSDWKIFDIITLKNLNFNEFLYSKSYMLDLCLTNFVQTQLQYVKFIGEIQFDRFPLIKEKTIQDILKMKHQEIYQIQFSFQSWNIEWTEKIEKLLNMISIDKEYQNTKAQLKSIIIKDCPQFSVNQKNIVDYQVESPYLYNLSQKMIFYNTNLFNSFDFSNKNVYKYVQFFQLQILDFTDSNLTGKQFITFCQNVQQHKLYFIKEINLSNIFSITDDSINAMINQQREVKYSQNKKQKDNRVPTVQKPVANEIKQQQQSGNIFPYLRNLKIKNTSVTQYSLIKIIQRLPFSYQFDIQSLLNQYQSTTKITDETLMALKDCPYFKNIIILDLLQSSFTAHTFQELITSQYCYNVEQLLLNCEYLNESSFIGLAKTNHFPKLKTVKVINTENCVSSIGYLTRAKYFQLNFSIENFILGEKKFTQQRKFMDNLIQSLYMRNIIQLTLDDMNDNMIALKEFFQFSKFSQNLQQFNLRNVVDKQKYYYTWKELSDSPCFPSLKIISIQHLRFPQNLNILLQQKFKPHLNLSILIEENEHLINDESIQVLSSQQITLNSVEFSFKKMEHIRLHTWNKFVKSHYSYNIRYLEMSQVVYNPNAQQVELEYNSVSLQNLKNDKNSSFLQVLMEGNLMNLQYLNLEECKKLTCNDFKIFLTQFIEEKIKIDIFDVLNQFFEKYQELFVAFETLKTLKQNQSNEFSQLFDFMRKKKIFDFLSETEKEKLFKNIDLYRSACLQSRLQLDLEIYDQLNALIDLINYLKGNFFNYPSKFFKNKAYKKIDLSFLNFNISSEIFLSNFKCQFLEEITFYCIKGTDLFRNHLTEPFLKKCKNLKYIKIRGSSNYLSDYEEFQYIVDSIDFPLLKEYCPNLDFYSIFAPFMEQLGNLKNKALHILPPQCAFQVENDVSLLKIRVDIQTLFSIKVSNQQQVNYLIEKYIPHFQKIELISEEDSAVNVQRFVDVLIQNPAIHKMNVSNFIMGDKYKITDKQMVKLIDFNIFDIKFNLFQFIATNLFVQQLIQLTPVLNHLQHSYAFYSQQKSISLFCYDIALPCYNFKRLNNLKKVYVNYFNHAQLQKKILISFFEIYWYKIPFLEFKFPSIKIIDVLQELLTDQQFINNPKIVYCYPTLVKLAIEQSYKHQNYQLFDTIFSNLQLSKHLKVLHINATLYGYLFSNSKVNPSKYNIFVEEITFCQIPKQPTEQFITFLSNLKYLKNVKFQLVENLNDLQEGKNVDTSDIKIFFPIMENTKYLNVIDCILQQFSHQISSEIMDKILERTKLQMIEQLNRISFKNNKFFEIQTLKDKIIQENIKKDMKNGSQLNNSSITAGNSKVNEVKKVYNNIIEEKRTKNSSVSQVFRQSETKTPQELTQAIKSAEKINTPLEQKQEGKTDIIAQNQNIQNAIKEKKDRVQQKKDQKTVDFETKINGSSIITKSQKIQNVGNNLICEKQLVNFLTKFKSLNQINFTNSSIKQEHYQYLIEAKSSDQKYIYKKFTFLNLSQCNNLTRLIELLQIFQKQDLNPNFEFYKFLENLPSTELQNSKKNVYKKVVEILINCAFFKKNVKYLRLDFLFKKSNKPNNLQHLQKIFDPIKNYDGNLNINITSFLQYLPQELKQIVNDQLIQFLVQKYSPIDYLQPEHYIQVQYAFNSIVQQKELDTDTVIMYFLNQKFQKSVSATTFELMYESVVIKEEAIAIALAELKELNQQLLEKKEELAYKRTKIDLDQQRQKKALQEKQEMNDLEKKIQQEKRQKELEKAEKEKQDKKQQAEMQKKEQEELLNKRKEAEKIIKQQKQEQQQLQQQQQDEEKKENLQLNDEQNQTEKQSYAKGVFNYFNMEAAEEKQKKQKEAYAMLKNRRKVMVREPSEENVSPQIQTNELKQENQLTQSLKQNNENNQLIQQIEKENIENIENLNVSPQPIYENRQENQQENKQENNLIDDQEKQRIINFQMSQYKKMNDIKNECDLLILNAYQLKNQDTNLIISEKLLNQIREIDLQLQQIRIQIIDLEEKQLQKYAKQSHGILFQFFDQINLSYNKFFNQKGLNKYIESYVNPWVTMNKNYQEVKKSVHITAKIHIFNQMNTNNINHHLNEYKERNDEINNIVKPDHNLDDKLLRNLVELMKSKMQQLRNINLSGLNVGDDFAEQFGLLLSNQDQFVQLKRIKLYHNQRLSSFGLKFLYSSIVQRIPKGFKIEISPSLYDFEHLKKNIQRLEQQLIYRIYKMVVKIKEKQEKNQRLLEKRIKELQAEGKQELQETFVKRSVEKKKLSTKVIPSSQNRKPINTQKDNKPTNNTGKMNEEDNLRLLLEIAIENNYEKLIFGDGLDQDNNRLSQEFEQIPDILNKKDDGKKEERNNYDNEDDENEENEDEDDEEMLIQIKSVDEKKDFSQWKLLSCNQNVSPSIVRLIQEDQNNEYTDEQTLIDQILCLRLKYEKSLIQIKAQNISADEEDFTIMTQNLVNQGLYDTINYLSERQWESKPYKLILFAILFFPFTVFHLFKVFTYKITNWIKNYQFDQYLDQIKIFGQEYTVEITKIVPSTVSSEDFYFDEDVARLDDILSHGFSLESQKKQNFRAIKNYLKDPSQSLKTYQDKFIINQQSERSFHILKYAKYIFFLNMIIFQIFICILWPYYFIIYEEFENCEKFPVEYDIPFYIYSLIQSVIEILMLRDIENIIGVKQIFTVRSAFCITMTFSSFMARYDMYTDVIFAIKAYYCKKLDQQTLGIISLTIMSVNFFFLFLGQIWEFIILYLNVNKNKTKSGQQTLLHNTNFINQFTKIALIQEFNAFGETLDRFSTSSAVDLDYRIIPESLRNVKVPQVFMSKFQRVFIEDIPQIFILSVFNYNNTLGSWYEFDNLKVILTTVVTLYNSLSEAWMARPSIFRTYQMQEYLEFREKYNDIYRIKIGIKGFGQKYLELDEITQKIEKFNKKNELYKELHDDKKQHKTERSQSKKRKSQIGSQSMNSENQSKSEKSSVEKNQKEEESVGSDDQINQQQKLKKQKDKQQKQQQNVKEYKRELFLELLGKSEFNKKL